MGIVVELGCGQIIGTLCSQVIDRMNVVGILREHGIHGGLQVCIEFPIAGHRGFECALYRTGTGYAVAVFFTILRRESEIYCASPIVIRAGYV